MATGRQVSEGAAKTGHDLGNKDGGGVVSNTFVMGARYQLNSRQCINLAIISICCVLIVGVAEIWEHGD